MGSFVADGRNRVCAHLVGVRSTERFFATAQQLACVPYRAALQVLVVLWFVLLVVLKKSKKLNDKTFG